MSNLNVLFLWQNLVQEVPAPTSEVNWEAMFIASARTVKVRSSRLFVPWLKPSRILRPLLRCVAA